MRIDEQAALQLSDAPTDDGEVIDVFFPAPTVESIDISRQLLDDIRAVHHSLQADSLNLTQSILLPPPNSPSPVIREFEWAPVVSSICTFAAILVSAYLVKQLFKDDKWRQRKDVLFEALRACFAGQGKDGGKQPITESLDSESNFDPLWVQAVRLAFCTTGILTFYIWYGVLQERTITRPFGNAGQLFDDTNFLVFTNRILATLLCLLLVFIQNMFLPNSKVPHTVPLYLYSYGSFSNNISTQAQYEMLKYLSFPLQVLGKSCKVPPVMLFQFILERRVYTYIEYSLGVIIVFGAITFQTFSQDVHSSLSVDNLPAEQKVFGVVLLLVYICFDSFTSNWQHTLFKDYSVDWLSMSLWSNIFATVLSFVGVLVSSELSTVLNLIGADTDLALNIFFLGLSSAIGNCFVYYTIKHFGPVVFAAIATVRQIISIIISVRTFDHDVNGVQVLGIILVFSAILVPLYRKARRAIKTQVEASYSEQHNPFSTSWWPQRLCCSCSNSPAPPLLPSKADSSTENASNTTASSQLQRFALFTSNRFVRIGLLISCLTTIQIVRSVLARSTSLSLGVPIYFSFMTSLITLIVLTFSMAFRPRSFAFPQPKDLPLISFCAAMSVAELAVSYATLERLSFRVYLGVRAFDVVITAIIESLYVRQIPSWLTSFLVALIAASSFLYTYDPTVGGSTAAGIVLACVSSFITPIKQVSLRAIFRHLKPQLPVDAFIYWIELIATAVWLIWSLSDGQFTTFLAEDEYLSPGNNLIILFSAFLSAARIIMEIGLLAQASAITCSVAQNFAASVCAVISLAWHGSIASESFSIVDKSFAKDSGSEPLIGLNIAALSMLIIAHACFAYFHVQNPDSYSRYPPIEGEAENSWSSMGVEPKLHSSGMDAKPASRPVDPRGVQALMVTTDSSSRPQVSRNTPGTVRADPRGVKVM